jgi:hypothetical protein
MNIRDIGGSSPFLPPAHRPAQRPSGQVPEAVPSGKGQAAPEDGRPLLTGEEKQFFESVFPEAKRDIRAFQAYTGRGTRPADTTGSNVDRKA